MTIVNLDKCTDINLPDFPTEASRGSHNIKFGPTIYIEKSDFKESEEKGYRRLTPGMFIQNSRKLFLKVLA